MSLFGGFGPQTEKKFFPPKINIDEKKITIDVSNNNNPSLKINLKTTKTLHTIIIEIGEEGKEVQETLGSHISAIIS